MLEVLAGFVCADLVGGVGVVDRKLDEDGVGLECDRGGQLCLDPALEPLGVIRGRLGEIPDGSRVLGYVVLPDRLDLTVPIDIYWNDLVVTATLQP